MNDSELSVEAFAEEVKKLLSKIPKNEIPTASEELIKMAIAAREETQNGEFEFEFDVGGDSKYTSVAKRKKLRTLDKIRDMLRDTLPPDGLAKGEKVNMPFGQEFEGFTEENTMHVDSFLYPNEDAIDEYCEKGVLSRNYCTKCGSRDCKELNFLSHSITDTQADFIFSNLLTDDLKDKIIIDVGSRIGVLLYNSFLFTDCKNIIGIEFNKYFVDIQQSVSKKFKMTQRVNVIYSDVRDKAEILKSGDVIFLNNVFEAFVVRESQKDIWKFVLNSLKPGAILITIPSIQQSFADIELHSEEFDWNKYLEEKKVEIPATYDEDEKYDIDALHCYQVK